MAKMPKKQRSTHRPTQSRPVQQTRRERLETKESAIVRAAYDMFLDKGFAKSTISDIARLAGVAEGTVYLYFNNKEALASAVIASFYESLTEAAEKGVAKIDGTREKLQFLADHHLISVLKERRILELPSVTERHVKVDDNGALYTMNKRYVAIFDSVVRDGVWRGDIAEGYSPWVLRDIFYGGLEYAMRTILLTRRQQELKDFTKQLVRLVAPPLQSDSLSKPRDPQLQLTKLADRMDGIVERMEMANGPNASTTPSTTKSTKARRKNAKTTT